MTTPRKTVAVLLAAAALFIFSLPAFALDVPALKGRVNDYADMISPSTEQQMEIMLANLENTDSTQIAVLTVPSLEGDSLEEFSMRVVEQWKLGQKNKDNGALLLVSKGDRKMRIEVGYGLEGVLTDVLAGQIVDNVITPEFRSGKIDEGFLLATAAMVKAAKGEFKGSGLKRKSRGGASLFKVLFLLLFLPIWMFSFMGRAGRRGGGGLLPLLLLGGMMSSSSRSSGFGGGGFGGGGFGGFSGGGGGFGGGGASGGW